MRQCPAVLQFRVLVPLTTSYPASGDLRSVTQWNYQAGYKLHINLQASWLSPGEDLAWALFIFP